MNKKANSCDAEEDDTTLQATTIRKAYAPRQSDEIRNEEGENKQPTRM